MIFVCVCVIANNKVNGEKAYVGTKVYGNLYTEISALFFIGIWQWFYLYKE